MALVPRSNREQEETDRDAGVVRNTPFGSSGSSRVRVDRGTGFNASGARRVRSRRPRRPDAPASNRPDVPLLQRQQQAARNLVSRPDRGEQRDVAGDTNALLQAPIAGLTEGAVDQENQRFDSVSDPATGISVPNLGDENTKAAFDRFFDTSIENKIRSGGQTPSQSDRNADPTRAAFQSTFFPSETLGDVGEGKNRRFTIR